MEEEPTMTHYRGVFITHHAPFVVRNDAGYRLGALRYSFTVKGLARMAQTLEEAHQEIDDVLGPELPPG